MVVVDVVSKNELRNFAKIKRNNILNKELKEKIITDKLLNHKKIINSNNILIYVSKDKEVSTKLLIKELLKLKKNIFVPKVLGNIIKFYKIESLDEVKKSTFEIEEPISNIEYVSDKNSVCIIPGLLFDKFNNRLGYGGGFYDKFLSKNKVYKIGICFNDFLVDKIDIDVYDIKMDEVITEV